MLIKAKGFITNVGHDYGIAGFRGQDLELTFSGRARLPSGVTFTNNEVDVYVVQDMAEEWRVRAKKAEERAVAAERILAELRSAISKVTSSSHSTFGGSR